MDTSSAGSYTAKLIDGPLEGKTVATSFSDSGDPQARITLKADAGKRYVYSRGGGLEFESAGSSRPSAVEYRFIETVFD